MKKLVYNVWRIAKLLLNLAMRPVVWCSNLRKVFKKKKVPVEYVIPISKTEKLVIPEAEIESYLNDTV
jgi:hypothetical protein